MSFRAGWFQGAGSRQQGQEAENRGRRQRTGAVGRLQVHVRTNPAPAICLLPLFSAPAPAVCLLPLFSAPAPVFCSCSCCLPTAPTLSTLVPNLFRCCAVLTLDTVLATLIHLHIEVHQRLDLNAFNFAWRQIEANDRAATDDSRAE